MADPFIGEIRIFAGTYAPRNWALCDGQLIDISQNETLFSLLGTFYGGDGRTNFALPDMRGRLPVHQGNGTGLTTRPIGQRGGVERVQITLDQIPGHTHQLEASNDPGTKENPAGQVTALGSSDPLTRFYSTRQGTPDAPLVSMPEAAVQSSGGDQVHTNLMPSLCVNFIIALQGIYPPRN